MARGREARTTEETLYYGRDNLYSEGFFFVIVREERITGLLARVLFFFLGFFCIRGFFFFFLQETVFFLLFFFSFGIEDWMERDGLFFPCFFYFILRPWKFGLFSCLRTGFSTNFFFLFGAGDGGTWRFFFSFSDSFSLSWGFEGEKCITKPQVKS
jgi:hypothetical protein